LAIKKKTLRGKKLNPKILAARAESFLAHGGGRPAAGASPTPSEVGDTNFPNIIISLTRCVTNLGVTNGGQTYFL
jgi:hypothetical protein